MSEAFNRMGQAFDSKKKEWYGHLWDSVDFYGIPDRHMPEEQRQDIIKYLHGANTAGQFNLSEQFVECPAVTNLEVIK